MTKSGKKRKDSPVEEDSNRRSNRRSRTPAVDDSREAGGRTSSRAWYPSKSRFTLNLRSLRDSTPGDRITDHNEQSLSPVRTNRTETTLIRKFRYDNEPSQSQNRSYRLETTPIRNIRHDNETSPSPSYPPPNRTETIPIGNHRYNDSSNRALIEGE